LSGLPGEEAMMVTCDVPNGVLEEALTVSVTEAGFPLTRSTKFDG
jgi:hypothetical protein